MNCCTDHGECHQGRDCPIRKQKQLDLEEMGLEENYSWLPIIVFVVALCAVIFILVNGGPL